MRIGVDVDGILANFFKAYEDLIVKLDGEDKFPARYPQLLPCTWNWPQHYGYSEAVIDQAWTHIRGDSAFWAYLDALPGADEFLERLDNSDHEVYFITDRPGIGPQVQTQYWLGQHGYWGPNVIISRKGKGCVCDALSIEVYIDDKLENIMDVSDKSPATRRFAIEYPYNEGMSRFADYVTLPQFAEEINI